jgi:hypothetical protein
MSNMPTILAALRSHRFPLDDEKRLQAVICDTLSARGFAIEREVALGDGDIIDAVVGTVGIEIKIKGARRRIYQQCERYLRHERIEALILATSLAISLPVANGAKPCVVCNLGRAWL